LVSLRRRVPQPYVIECVLGRCSLATIAATVAKLLRDEERHVVVQINGFDYFDEHDLAALTDLATWSERVEVVGLDAFAQQLLPAPTTVDVRSAAERAVTHLSGVTVVTAINDGRPLDDNELDETLRLAKMAGRAIVTVDLRHVENLPPAQVLTVAETWSELQRSLRTMILVNATTLVAEQLRSGGVSGALGLTTDELM
jgi:hypothetical protein